MGNKQERLQSRIGPEIAEFRQRQRTLQLATVSANGMPHASYSPYVFLPEGYYILVSDLAQHGQNLKVCQHVSIMMIEDEDKAKSIYARRRLSFDAQAIHVERDSATWLKVLSAMEDRLGEMASNLSQLGDFHLYHLKPERGRFVKGFGKAFDITEEDMVDIVHLDKGHITTTK